MATLTYGQRVRCQLDLDDYTFLGAEREQNPPLSDLIGAMRSALARPNGYPSLAAATVPGDRVAVMVGPGLPQAAMLVRGAIAALLDAGVNAELVTVVFADELGDQAALEQEFAGNGAAGVRFERHDPDSEFSLAMIGVTRAGEPLRFNRTMVEADFVLPIGLGRLPGAKGDALGKYEGLFPEFSSRESCQRMHAQAASESAKERRKSVKQMDEAGWLAGVGMTVSVVQGAHGGVAAVLAGDPEVVSSDAANRSRAIWERTSERSGDLVIAAISGEEHEQTWENVARAIVAANVVLNPGGAIAICSEISKSPSGPLNKLKNAVDFGEVQEKLAREDAATSFPARVIAQALEQGPVYFRSRLSSDVVEALGLTPIESDAELSRLASERGHCVVIEEAQRIVPRLVQRGRP